MNSLRLPLVLAAVASAALSTAQSPYLAYEFNGSLAPTTGTGPALVGNGGTVDADSYDFGAGQGLSLLTTAVDSTTTYTVHMGFSLADVPGFNKIIDTKDRTQDQGLYIRTGVLDYYNVDEGTTLIANNQFVQVTLVRDGASNEVRGYVDGVRQFAFIDTATLATFSGTNVEFFRDDNSVGGEQSAGTADFIRFYSGALNDNQVAAINQPVPEPATLAALGLGAAALLRRRRKA